MTSNGLQNPAGLTGLFGTLQKLALYFGNERRNAGIVDFLLLLEQKLLEGE